MGKQFVRIEPEHAAFIERQKIFFVASAPPKGRVNVSPKGLSSFRVLGETDVAYLDCTGSGSETRAHLIASDDKRLTIMFCAFDGAPMILRLYARVDRSVRGSCRGASNRAPLDRPRADLVRDGRAPVRLQAGAWQPRALLDGAGRQQSAKILGSEEHEEHRRPADRLCP
jgi:hypothetical protein